ncbi:DUF3800 domain-containing protein [Caulobacter sp.]|uniref:DUF3800 domain-containing protein n=1 Tax=Caulobacter sp. TaxID=78 RepID=UPI0031E035D9
MIDIDEIREVELAMGLPRLNAVFTLYYDETNNIRRLHIRPDGLNVKQPKVFVLGGVAHPGAPKPIELTRLRADLRLQPSVRELKFKHLADGEFLEALASPKVGAFLDWLLAEHLTLHVFALDPLYWSIVDVIDSILAERRDRRLNSARDHLKNDLYGLLRLDPDRTVDLLGRYNYPDVGRARRKAFIAELLVQLEENVAVFPEFNYDMLKGVLQIAYSLERLPFLEDEQANVLIDRFATFFVKRICLFKHSHHVLDVEELIEAEMLRQPILDRGAPYEGYRFAVSHDEAGIQVADLTVGLLGRLFSFVVIHDRDSLDAIRQSLSERQAATLASLSQVLAASLKETPAFVQVVMSLEDQFKLWRFVDAG